MKQFTFLALAAVCVFLTSCVETPPEMPAVSSRTGSIRNDRTVGRQRVVTFPEVRDATTGTAAEHNWTDENYPGSRWTMVQILEDSEGRVYHRVLLVDARGRERSVYFDVSNWAEGGTAGPGARIR